jgi:hypothetical protein
MHQFRQFHIRDATVLLQFMQDADIDPVEFQADAPPRIVPPFTL